MGIAFPNVRNLVVNVMYASDHIRTGSVLGYFHSGECMETPNVLKIDLLSSWKADRSLIICYELSDFQILIVAVSR